MTSVSLFVSDREPLCVQDAAEAVSRSIHQAFVSLCEALDTRNLKRSAMEHRRMMRRARSARRESRGWRRHVRRQKARDAIIRS